MGRRDGRQEGREGEMCRQTVKLCVCVCVGILVKVLVVVVVGMRESGDEGEEGKWENMGRRMRWKKKYQGLRYQGLLRVYFRVSLFCYSTRLSFLSNCTLSSSSSFYFFVLFFCPSSSSFLFWPAPALLQSSYSWTAKY